MQRQHSAQSRARHAAGIRHHLPRREMLHVKVSAGTTSAITVEAVGCSTLSNTPITISAAATVANAPVHQV